jgi:hypothetical protein
MDGTFSVTPNIFAQLYTIHIKLYDEFVPQMWCLLPDKQGATYVRLFQLLSQEAVHRNWNLQPATVHIDFEQAVMQAVQTVFGIQPTGCMFHFCQSILRHVQQTGLQAAYYSNNPPEVRKWIRRIMALALVPPLRVDQAFEATVANAPNVAGCDDMHHYIRVTYMDDNTALFGRDTWNCFGTRDRTTNACEGYHSRLNSHFRGRHADPYKFVCYLQKEEKEIEIRVGQLQVGAPPKKRKSKYVLVDEAIDRLRDQYFGNGIPSVARLLQYMDAVAHQLCDVKH